MEQIEDISKLIYRKVTGRLTEKEQKRLDDWICESEDNRSAIYRLTNNDYLRQEYLRRQAVNSERALADMQRRISASGRKAWIKYAAAAIVAVCLTGVAAIALLQTTRNFNTEVAVKASNPIEHGSIQATLTLASGETMHLGSDSVFNSKLLASNNRPQHSTQQSVQTPGNSQKILSTPRGGEFKVTLEDGTEVWLNAESQLRYPDTFDGPERRVEVSGEAYFRVAKDETKPFLVEAAGQLIRVTGTEFNVNNYRENDIVYTTLVSGSITTSLLSGEGGEMVLTPGHQTVMQVGSNKMQVRKVDTGVVTSWTHGRFVFENQTLEQMMRSLSRWYDFEYEFLDNDLRQTVFMGSVPRYGDFSEVISILEKSGGLKFLQKGKTIYISKKQ